MQILYIYGSVIAVSLVSVLAAIPLLLHKTTPKGLPLFLLSLSVGTLMGSVFLHFLPEAFGHEESTGIALSVLAGFLAFFLLEKLVHHHHKHGLHEGHSHAYHLAPLNLIGDGIHNFIDGMIIAGSYLVSIPLGVAATVSVLFHEIPQEIADFGVLLYAGLSKKKALLFNFLSATTAIVGATIAILLAGTIARFSEFIVPFAAGTFIYIAAANLIPELHREEGGLKVTLVQLAAMLVGIGIMVALAFLAPEHAH